MRKRVLLIEDEADILDLIRLHLERDGYVVDACTDGEEGMRALAGGAYDLLVVDWMLPGRSGLDVTRAVRADAATRQLPILMVTARTEAADIVAGLEAGADDYVTKPFEVPVLLARARSLLRRAGREELPPSGEKVRLGGVEIDPAAFEARCEGRTVELTPSEFKLLLALAQNRGRVMTRDRLIDAVQGAGVSVVDRAIDTHVFGLRKKLGACAEVIETVRGVGYRVRGDAGATS